MDDPEGIKPLPLCPVPRLGGGWHLHADTCWMCVIPASQGQGCLPCSQPKKLHRVCLTLSVSTSGSGSALKNVDLPFLLQIVALGRGREQLQGKEEEARQFGAWSTRSRRQIENPTLGTWKGDGRKYHTWTKAPFPEPSSTVPSEFTYKFKIK